MAETGSVKAVKEFFEYKNASEFMKDWKALDDVSKEQLKSGIANGTFDY